MERKIETDLTVWRGKRVDRIPPIVNGVRQVEKTYLLRRLGERRFKNVMHINLETNLAVASFLNSSISPEKLLCYLETSAGEKIIAREALVIFDGIQSYERALTSLKYFCKKTPEFHIAAAGSLLGVTINRR